MTQQREVKKEWITPKVTRYGSVREITQQIKTKVYGGGDDVLVNNQQILATAAGS